METYFYRCPVCGFVYQVPAYWVDYDPKETMQEEHLDFKTGAVCENRTLEYQKED